MKTIKIFAALVAFVIASVSAVAQGDFISAADYMKIAKDANTVVISTQKKANFDVSHLTGSVHIFHKDLYKAGEPEGLLLGSAELAKKFGAKGVSEKNTIVVYDDGDNKYAGRMYWILKYLGAKNVKILHKDMAAWRTSRVPITKEPTTRKAATFTVAVNAAFIADYNFVKSNLTNANTVIVDARAAGEYKGTAEESKGHIPGAKNLEWKELTTESGAIKSAEELKKIFAAKGITADKTIILYCETSVRAGIEFAALTSVLGYKNVKVYDGAYNEWVFKGEKVDK